jgi:enoyl-CoA hydratase/carnithine racemase
MSFEEILYETSEGIATITLNRPERLNAWTATMERELRQATEAAAADDAVRVILVTGAGRGFCAGADMSRLSGVAAGRAETRPSFAPYPPLGGSERPDFRRRVSYFPAVGKPVIGVINGPAAGIGLVLALYFDMRIAGSEALFITAFARRGLIAEYGASWALSRLVGPAHALDLLLSSRRVGADEALRLGLVNQVVPQDELMTCARAYARDLALLSSPRAMRVMKRQVWEAQLGTLSDALDLADHEMAESFKSEDFREGVAHFAEKRPPRFTGH